MASRPASPTRSVEASIRIDASIDDVWRAIADGEWLARWLSPIASVTPGAGGSVTVSWGGDAEWTSRITAWEPGVHMRLEDQPPAEAASVATDDEAPAQTVTTLDYYLEPAGGGTTIRLVNAGYSTDAEWDEYVRMAENGWRFFLWNMKHALERHLGVPRTMISVRPWVTGSRAEVWDRVFGPEGLGPLAEDDAQFRFVLDEGQSLEGAVVVCDRPWAFAGVVESLNAGVLHVELEGAGDRWKLGVWLSLYGGAEDEHNRIREALQKTINRIVA